MARQRITERRRKDTDADYTPNVPCVLCANDNPHTRYEHYLDLAKWWTFEAIRAHLIAEMGRQTHDPDLVASAAKGVLEWLKETINAYTTLGACAPSAPLSWWDARQQHLQRHSPATPQERDHAGH